MAFISRIFQKFARAAELLENPRLIGVRWKGGSGSLSTVRDLDKPWLHELRVATVLDIGANAGQFAIAARVVLPRARIISFEPLPECFQTLQTRMRGDANFAAFNTALGDTDGELTIQRNEFSMASSFLPMNETHTHAFDFARRTEPVNVKIQRLDDVAPSLGLAPPYLVKIDVQGYEDRVLRGGEHTISGATALLVEMSHVPLYEGQILFDGLYATIRGMGFSYRGALDQLHSPKNGNLLQENGIFIKLQP